MAYTTLKSAIQAVIKQNGNNEITGALLQQALLSMIDSLGAEYQFGGGAEPTDNPGTPDYKVAYIASTPGAYVNFGNIQIANGEVAILKWNGTTWIKGVTGIASTSIFNNTVTTDAILDDAEQVNDAAKIPSVNFLIGAIFNTPNWKREEINISDVQQQSYMMLQTGYMGTTPDYTHSIIPVNPGDVISIATGNVGTCRVAFLTDLRALRSGTEIPCDSVPVLDASANYLLKAPAGAVALCFNRVTTSGNITPTSITRFSVKEQQEETINNVPIIAADGWLPDEDVVKTNSAYVSYIIPIKSGYQYTVDYERNTTGDWFLYWGVVSTLPYPGQSLVDSASGVRPRGRFSYVATIDGYLIISQSNQRTLSLTNARAEKVNELGMPRYCWAGMPSDVERLVSEKYGYNVIPLSTLITANGGFINRYGVWQYGSAMKFAYVPVTPGDYVKIVPGTNSARIAFLTSNPTPVQGDPAPLVANTGMMYVESPVLIKIPTGTNYLYIYFGASPYNYMPEFVGVSQGGGDAESASQGEAYLQTLRHHALSQAVVNGLIELNHAVTEDGWDVSPTDLQHLNTIKRARQMCGIKWTPKANIMGTNDPAGTKHAAGVEQTGIPYSGNWHNFKYVGIEVSLHTFMTAVNNPYSLLYSENVSKDYTRSAWGKTYYNTNGWAYYGTVCCGLTATVNGQPTKYGNVFIHNVARGIGIFVPLFEDRNLNNLNISDVYDNNHHSFVIIGLHRDENGDVDKVKIAEALGSDVQACRIRDYTASAFINHLNGADPYIGYRVSDLFKNTHYEPSPYVPLSLYGETADPVVYNDDICCFAGDKATFMRGDLVALNYNLNGTPAHTWTAIEVYKDENLIGTYQLSSIDQSALDESQRGHALNLGTELLPGQYKARMTDGTNVSDFTYWEVLPNNVTVQSVGGGGYLVKANADQQMMYVYCGQTYDGGEYYFDNPSGVDFFNVRAGREPDWNEARNNEMLLYFDLLIESCNQDPAENSQIRVMFKGQYGMAATPPITLPGR